jgi:hypothetical protein
MIESTTARAMAAAAVLLAGDRAARVLGRIGGLDAAAAREVAAGLLATRGEARAHAVAQLAAPLRAPRPPALERVHPTWRDAALAGEDPRVRAIVDGALEAAPDVKVWAERRAFASLRGMPAGGADRIHRAEDLAHARADALVLRLERAGVRQLAHATASAPEAELAALAQRLGARGRVFVEMARRVRELGDAAVSRLGPRRAAQARCAGVAVATDPHGFVAIGARALAPHVARGDLAWQLAQRLPIDVGRRVLAELLRWGGEGLHTVPGFEDL